MCIRDRLRDGDRIEHYVTTRLRKDGTSISISLCVSPIRDVTGKIVGASKIARDVTERQRTMDALKESQRRFRMMADSAAVMVWVSGSDKRCTFFNKRWLDFTGHTLEQELAEGWGGGIHPE